MSDNKYMGNSLEPELSNTQLVNSDGVLIHIIRTNRQKTLAVTIKQGGVSVFVPQRTSMTEIEDVIARKSGWINKKLLLQSDLSIAKSHDYVEGEHFKFRGETRTLKLISGERKRIVLDANHICLYSNAVPSSLTIRNRLTKWYREQAQLYLARRTRYFSALLLVRPLRVNVRTYRARWGCCSTNKEITYNWLIIMAPENIIDYLIVHELCHIKEHNHSRAFWKHVENILPDYKESRAWLDSNGHLLKL